MPEPISFNKIDFEAIEYRNEYRHTKAAFALMATQIYAVTNGFNMLFKTTEKDRNNIPVVNFIINVFECLISNIDKKGCSKPSDLDSKTGY